MIAMSLVTIVSMIVAIVYTIRFYDCNNALESAQYDLDRLQARYKELAESTPSPFCLCSHGINVHENDTGRCGHVSYQGATILGWEIATKCQCKHYVGPQAVPTFYHPELL